MSSCLGFYTDKNMIKYAKISSDPKSDLYTLEAYGVKFYDNIMTTIDEILQEVKIDQCTVSLGLSNEGYHDIEVFRELKSKDRNDLIQSEFNAYCESEGLVNSALELRYQLVQNTGNMDKLLAICSYVAKSELANLNKNFEGLRITAVAPVGLSIENIFRNKGIDEEAAIVNIENKTTVTILLRNEVQDVIDIPLGMQDILDKLAEKYNSYSKAYEACKKVSVYIDDVTTLDEESRDVLDVVLPVLYDIRQRVDEAITPYKRLMKSVYLSGSAVVVNNVDLYFQESFPGLRCVIAKPFLISQKDKEMEKEIVEVNSAIAIALNGFGMMDPSINFHGAAKKAMKSTPLKDAFEKINIKGKIKDAKTAAKEYVEEIKRKVSTPKRGRTSSGPSILEKIHLSDKLSFLKKGGAKKGSRGKVRVAYDADVGDIQATGGLEDGGMPNEPTALDKWLVRLTITCVGALVLYVVAATYITNTLEAKLSEADSQISKGNAEITLAASRADYIRTKTSEYSEKISKLEEVMQEIETEKMKRSFDIPNFMSQVMFIIPQGVSITSIDVSETGKVDIVATSPQYAQLGYFVSRLKLEKVLLNVDMTVEEMDQTIKIKVGGMLP